MRATCGREDKSGMALGRGGACGGCHGGGEGKGWAGREVGVDTGGRRLDGTRRAAPGSLAVAAATFAVATVRPLSNWGRG